MSERPSISVRITTSSPIFDLSKQEEFIITLTLTLDHSHPITFDKRWAGLFDGKLLYQDGLTFFDISTGEPVPRGTIDICYRSSYSEDGLSETTKDKFVTLHPGEGYSRTASFKPISSNPKVVTDGLTDDEISQKQKSLGKIWKWHGIAGMEDSQSYEISVSNEAAVKQWIQGSVSGLLEMQKLGLAPTVKRDVVRYVVDRPARFEMRRPDKDGSLNWP